MTATTDEARARSRELRLARIAANPNRLCPPDHKHGETSTCFNGHGCRCAECRAARAAAKRREYYGVRSITRADVKVSSIGVQRRLQALAYMGWSCQVIADRIGSHYRPLNRLRDGGRKHVMQSTHDAIDRVFRELAMTVAPGHSGRVTRGFARRLGFRPAVVWDDIDDPRERPQGVPEALRDRTRIDREQVAWLASEGLSDSVIADRIGCNPRTVLRVRQELGLESKWAA